jgi:hypothetical protein
MLFFMVYGVEAILPIELHYGSPRVQAYQSVEAKRARQDDITCEGTSPSPDQPDTNRHFDDITCEGSTLGLSR